MNSAVFDRETLLDTVVNLVPLAILAFFTLLFAVFNPWATGSVIGRVMQYVLIAVPFVLLTILTYVTAKRL